MTVLEFAMRMYPYWIAGWTMLLAIYFSPYRELLRVDKKAVVKFSKLLVILAAFRMVVFFFFADRILPHVQGANFLPWETSLTVFWEDALHTLPLVIGALMMGMDKWYKKVIYYVAMVIVMIAFGLGHTYQGMLAAFALSFYIPFTIEKGRQYGFGTVMICHCLYDLSTMLVLKHFLG